MRLVAIISITFATISANKNDIWQIKKEIVKVVK